MRHFIDGRLLYAPIVQHGQKVKVSVGVSEHFQGQAWLFEEVELDFGSIEHAFLSPRQKRNNYFFYEDTEMT